ncbi:PAS domain-containing protein [Robiginitalea sp. M366]|uniref:PAS domain-containing sensor histidine kinase n=1 Tax=Robiginitalea aestuariiviva TaxID=3036903 RepID=UPI00240D4248|nr:PAS domain-containing protein [Robiginitalea aestuariiviva]MDG1570736.1 PAS domain-containing protein [Robiginitalea aestuariiviva]
MLKRLNHDIQNYLIKQLPNPTAFLNDRLEVVYASDSWIEALMLQKDGVIGRGIWELIPQAPEHWHEILENCLKGISGQKGVERVVSPNREEKWFEYENNPWYDEQENVIGVLIQITDVTGRIKSEIRHEKTEILMRAQSELARIGSWEYDVVKDQLHWCNMTKEIHEVPLEFQPDLESAIEFYKEGYSRNTISMVVYRSIETGQPWSEKLQLVTANGREIWVIASGKPLYQNGKYIGLVGTFQDVTHTTQFEQRIIESEKLLRTVVDNLPLNLYIKDLESRKTLVNKSECEYLGVSDPSELLGKTDFDLLPKKMAQISRDEDLYVMSNGKSIIGKETLLELHDGSTTHFLSSKIPLFDAENQIYGLMGISLDITDLKQKQEELRELINVTSQQNKKLINFTHIVSHNLRSHSANFSMLLELLGVEEDPHEAQRIVGMLTKASNNLMETLENLNEVVAINTNTNIQTSRVDLHHMAEEAENNLAAYLGANLAKVVNEIPKATMVQAVPSYMENIISSLITNAVRYRHPDRLPVIRLYMEKTNNRTVLCVEDNGLGIDLDKYGDKLFGMYKTFHNHPDARGIGLYITKNQIEAMQASILTCSEVDQGTTFKIFFNDPH